MKARVVETFTDRHTGALHRIGDTFDVTVARLTEINSTSRGAFVEEIPEPDKKKPVKKG